MGKLSANRIFFLRNIRQIISTIECIQVLSGLDVPLSFTYMKLLPLAQDLGIYILFYLICGHKGDVIDTRETLMTYFVLKCPFSLCLASPSVVDILLCLLSLFFKIFFLFHFAQTGRS